MTITATNVVTPKGRIDLGVIWPGLETDTSRQYVEEYLQQGYSQTGSPGTDAAAELWAYYRAFDQMYLALIGQPSSATVNDEGSMSYTQTQIDNWKLEADAALDAYLDLVDAAAGEEPGEYDAITSYR